MPTKLMLIVAAVALSIVAPARSEAAQIADPQGHVVHNRRAPVVMHRMVPPYRGVHVYGGNAR